MPNFANLLEIRFKQSIKCGQFCKGACNVGHVTLPLTQLSLKGALSSPPTPTPTGFWEVKKQNREISRKSINVRPHGFDNLTTALYYVLCFFFSCNFQDWKHLAQASCTELTLLSKGYFLVFGLLMKKNRITLTKYNL